jgi:dTDP-4-amino-4,6-dideoxygalactose transaminase
MSVISGAVRQVPLLDLKAQYARIRDEVLAEVSRVLDSQQFILGEDVRKLEEELAQYSGARFGIGCASGSDALFLALMALGVEPGDRVITTPFTFFATAGAISRANAVPVFVDIDPATFNIDVNLLRQCLASEERVKAILPVHLYGGCADMDPVLDLARERNCAVIEDAAQAVGAEYKGKRAGSMGDIGCISFFPSKNLGGCGDGGMLTTNDGAVARKLAALRVHGGVRKYYHEWIGINSRLDSLQAAILRVKLRRLDAWTEARQTNAALYRQLLGTDSPVKLPAPASYQTRYVYNQFCVRCSDRDGLKEHLKEHGVGTEIYYPLPLHLQPCYRELGHSEGDFPASEQASREVLALPVHPDLAAGDIEYVCESIFSFRAKLHPGSGRLT